MQFIWPLDDYIITRDFYYLASLYIGGQHAALDLIRKTGATRAAPVRAVANGTVVGVGWDMYSGFFVAIDHAGGFRSFYRHLYGQAPVVVGQRVSQGQIIGNVGNTGWSQGDHLHFDLWSRNKIRDDNAIFYKNGWYAVDPELYLGGEDDMNEAEIRALVRSPVFREELMKITFAAYDGAAAKSGRRNLVTWAWSLIRHERNASLHGSGCGVSEARVTAIAKALIRKARLTIG